MKLRVKASQAGFSLIELLATVTLTAILSVVAIQLLVNGQLRSAQAESVARLRQQGDFILDQISYTLRNARSVTCTSETDITVETKNGSMITYELTAANQVASNSALLTTDDVTVEDLAFTCTDNTSNEGTLVDIEFTLTTAAQGQVTTLTQGFSTSVYVRSF